MELEGPFLYLTAMVSDRLESAFVSGSAFEYCSVTGRSD